MKIDLTTPIKNFDGENVKEVGGNKEIEIGVIIRNALGSRADNDTGDKMIKKYKLGLKCVGDEVDLSAEEITLIKKSIENLPITPLVYGRVVELIDPEALNS